MVCNPGEGFTIRNVLSGWGAYGVRCLGGGAPGLKLYNVSPHDAGVAGVEIEPAPGTTYAGGTHTFVSVSSDGSTNGGTASTQCMFLFNNCRGNVDIEDFKAEQTFGGGLVKYILGNSGSDNVTDNTGSIRINGGHYNGVNLNNTVPLDLVVLGTNSAGRTPSVSISQVQLNSVTNLIRDDLTGRRVVNNVSAYGNSQAAARVPIYYESCNYGTNYGISLGRSRLVIGQTVMYSFVPPSNGWYRVMSMLTHTHGRLTITSAFDDSVVDLESYPAGASPLYVNPTLTTTSAASPMVTRIRAGYWWDGVLGYSVTFADAYVNASPYGYPNDQVTFALDLNNTDIPSYGVTPLLSPVVALPGGAPFPSGVTGTNLLDVGINR